MTPFVHHPQGIAFIRIAPFCHTQKPNHWNTFYNHSWRMTSDLYENAIAVTPIVWRKKYYFKVFDKHLTKISFEWHCIQPFIFTNIKSWPIELVMKRISF